MEIAEARTELSVVRDFLIRVVDNGDTSLEDLEHVRLILGLTNTAEDLKSAQSLGTWVRNWQWGLTQIVYIYSERGITNASSFLGRDNPVIAVRSCFCSFVCTNPVAFLNKYINR